MIDISHKHSSLRYAKARGVLTASPQAISRVRAGSVPKGDVLATARSAGILAAKNTSNWVVFCHSMPLDWVDLSFEYAENAIHVFAEVRSVWKTGVEMEALSAVMAALLNMYDMLKPLDDDLAMGDIRLLHKRGGKNDFRDNFNQPLQAAVLVISDSTYAGRREDKSGRLVQDFLGRQGIDAAVYDILPDERERISARLVQLAEETKVDMIFTTGGTGLGPRDVTPEATRAIMEREVPGIAEAMRKHGGDRTPRAMLSRGMCVTRGECVIVNLPGSSRGAEESLQALFPGLPHALFMLWGLGHG